MNVLTRLWKAFASLAEAVEGIAGTVRTADASLKQRLALDGPADSPSAPTPAIIENATQGTPGALNGKGGRRAAKAGVESDPNALR
jgi:hypothetical protein